ncbi:MAG: lysozyme [Cognaticolwellia sp.]
MMQLKYFVLTCLIFLLGACSQTPIVPEISKPSNQSSSTQKHDPNILKTNSACINIIKAFEGVRLNAYKGPSGALLIGYGHMADVHLEMKISQKQAEQLLKDDLNQFEKNVAKNVKVKVTENEFSAMVCLSYNIGSGNFNHSTVLRKVNDNLPLEAADAFLMWNKVNKKVNAHQVKRRKSERALFVKP